MVGVLHQEGAPIWRNLDQRGSNALILTTELAKRGKVAIDFGRAMNPEYWSKYPSHPHYILNADKVRQPLIKYHPARNQALQAPSDIKGHLPE